MAGNWCSSCSGAGQLLWRVTQRQLAHEQLPGPRRGSRGGESRQWWCKTWPVLCPPPPPRSSPSPPFLFPFFAGIHSICGAPGRTGKCRRRLQFPDKVSRTRNIFRLTRRNSGSVWGETQGPTNLQKPESFARENKISTFGIPQYLA